MKAKIDGIELEGTPEEVLKYQKLHKRMQDDKGWEMLNKPVPVFNNEEFPNQFISHHLREIKNICDKNGYEYLMQIKYSDRKYSHYQSDNMLLMGATIYSQKALLDIKIAKEQTK